MKTNFINSLIMYLIEKEYFNFVSSENESPDFANHPVSIIKEFQGTSVLAEIIDAERLNAEQLTRAMESGAAMLNNINGSNASVFYVFLFDELPDEEKIRIIEQGQLDIIDEKKYLKCISVNIMSKQVNKHFNAPNFDAKLVGAIKKFFDKNLDTRETTREDILTLIEQRKKDYDIQLKAKTPWLTYGLIAVNIFVWLALKLISMKTGATYDSLLEPFGAKVNKLIMQGEYWRFITPMFLHGNEIHLAVNCYSLYVVGTQVEKLFGHARFAVIYFIAGFLGCVASFAFSLTASIGASGAIFGLLGAMLFFAVKRPSLLKSGFGANLISTLVINLAYGFMNPRIDNNGHLGGLVGGFLTTGVVYTHKDESSNDKLKKVVCLILVIAVTIGGLFYGFHSERNVILTKISALETLDSQKNWTESEKLGEEILQQNPSDKSIKVSVLWSLARSETFQKKYDESIEHAVQLSEISPVDGRYILGVNYYSKGEYVKAKQELLAAKELGSPNTETIDAIIKDIESK